MVKQWQGNMSKYVYYRSCVDWNPGDVYSEGGLSDMIDQGRDIGRRTFLKYVDRLDLIDLEGRLSYAPHPSIGLTMAGDWSVSYHRSKLHGVRCYYVRQSAIEYVFIQPGGAHMATREHLEFLDGLRGSGVTNMLGATPYLQKKFNLSEKSAKEILAHWIRTFGERKRGAS